MGIKVNQNASGITLSQGAYAGKPLQKVGMAECKPAHVPMEPHLKLSKDIKAPTTYAMFYGSVAVCLRYMVHTRPGPDISFVVG
jgi:hypothetical protein